MLVYLHGLNSSGRSYKAGVLRERMAPIQVLSPSYPAHRPDAAIAALADFFMQLAGNPSPIVIGSSMGGFYGQYLARQFTFRHLFLINPALIPWDLLSDYEGQSQTTDLGETYLVERELIDGTRRYGIQDPCDRIPTTLFLDKGDEVIDYHVAESLYSDCGRLIIFDGGDHGFRHLDEAITVIEEELAKE